MNYKKLANIDDELGIEWLDYDARQYDPETGRFLSIDPLADIATRWSPYAYALDNPLRYIDPDVMTAQACLKCEERTRTEQTVSDITFKANRNDEGDITSVDVSFKLTNSTITEVVNLDGTSGDYGKVVSAHTESVTSCETMTMTSAGNGGEFDRQTGQMMAMLGNIMIPGGNNGIKITADAKVENEENRLVVNVSSPENVKTEKSKLTSSSVDEIAAARDAFVNENERGILKKYSDEYFSMPKDRQNRLRTVSGNPEGRNQDQENYRRIRSKKWTR